MPESSREDFKASYSNMVFHDNCPSHIDFKISATENDIFPIDMVYLTNGEILAVGCTDRSIKFIFSESGNIGKKILMQSKIIKLAGSRN